MFHPLSGFLCVMHTHTHTDTQAVSGQGQKVTFVHLGVNAGYLIVFHPLDIYHGKPDNLKAVRETIYNWWHLRKRET